MKMCYTRMASAVSRWWYDCSGILTVQFWWGRSSLRPHMSSWCLLTDWSEFLRLERSKWKKHGWSWWRQSWKPGEKQQTAVSGIVWASGWIGSHTTALLPLTFGMTSISLVEGVDRRVGVEFILSPPSHFASLPRWPRAQRESNRHTSLTMTDPTSCSCCCVPSRLH